MNLNSQDYILSFVRDIKQVGRNVLHARDHDAKRDESQLQEQENAEPS